MAILLPARGLAAAAPLEEAPAEVAEYVASALAGDGAAPPGSVEAEQPVSAGDERIGSVVALPANGSGPPASLKLDRDEVLRAAALAALAEVAATDARDRLADEVRGGVLEDLRTRAVAPAETVRRAARLGCDLDQRRRRARRPDPLRQASLRRGVITSEWDGALAEPLGDGLLLALLPALDGNGEPEKALERARMIAGRMRSHGPAAFSSYCADPAELDRAVREAELALEVIARDGRLADQLQDGIGGGVYPLLFRALASSPEEVRSFYADTVESLVEHDRQYRTDLLGTLEAYLANESNTNATARAVFAHRHTVAHRLEPRPRAHRPRPICGGGPRAPRAGRQGLPDPGADPAALNRPAPGRAVAGRPLRAPRWRSRPGRRGRRPRGSRSGPRRSRNAGAPVTQHADREQVLVGEGDHGIDVLDHRARREQGRTRAGDVGDGEVVEARARGEPRGAVLEEAGQHRGRAQDRLGAVDLPRLLELLGLRVDQGDPAQGERARRTAARRRRR